VSAGDDTAKRDAVERFSSHVAALVRSTVYNPTHHAEACQAGVVGLLIALERYRPELVGVDRGAAFWNFARPYVRNEIRAWQDVGVYWRKSGNRGLSPHRVAQREGAKVGRYHDPFPAPPQSDDSSTVQSEDQVPDPGPSVEDVVAEAEALYLLRQFTQTLRLEDFEIVDSGMTSSRRYLEIARQGSKVVRKGERL
jgi:hypothetical protein